jgi:UDP-N-acetylmuramyl pentapeptide phosphotransferase/UDP-N-acetylglucosamine-1-phosphate transferase
MWPSVGLFIVTAVQACALTWCALHLGRRFRILDFPDKQRKLHSRATPRTGGLAICAALLLGVVEARFWNVAHLGVETETVRFTAFLLLSAVLLCGLGLWDDKYGLRARSKFAWQVAAVLPFVCWGRTTASTVLFGWHLDFAWLAVPVMLLWLVSCTNFVNLVDGLDGLAGTVGLIVSLAVAGLAWWNQVPEVFLMALILSGALIGFLTLNWPPARIFLGDSGSLPLGFLVGALALEASAKKAAGLTLAVPVVLLSIPMFDTSMAILRRKLNGRRIGEGDRAHIHHCLRDRGWSPAQTLVAIAAMCTATATAAVLGTVFNNDLIAVGICLAVLAVLISGRLFGFNETILLLRHFQAVGALLKSVPRVLRMKFVVVRLEAAVAAGRLDLWNKIIKRAQRLGGLEIHFGCDHRPSGRVLTSLIWTSAAKAGCQLPVQEYPAWQFCYSVPRGDGIETWIRAAGRAPHASGLPWLNELSELLVALCDNWPIDERATTVVEEARPAPPPAAADYEPPILTARWASSRSAGIPAEGSRRHAVESDAA